ncbi:Tn7-like element transposition protein TnsE [Methylomonas methanica]|uniref:TnsE C-terminal domain-containing protein n=1 Tax=Methylomonas methanica (strain DSM 25384 / MC09) TaxID=857087 RepID=G0A4U1_METMM|nr:Tn7-like element transposition protein TnsE [Methylomonas methanica]AEG02832.1 hypothetical protein Metme_4492 [Methylomonas methanica MC09]
MKGDFKYPHLDDDLKILGLGSLFCGINRKQWSVNLFLSGNNRNHIRFSAAPILVRYRMLNPSKSYTRSGKLLSFAVDDAQDWKVGKIDDCPGLAYHQKKNDSNQYCFVANVDGTEVYIPQFELARVLFYHDPFMARLSLQHNSLNEEFYIDESGEKATIHVLSEAEYPLCYYNRDDSRRFLSWVLLDTQARASFESISAGLVSGKNLSNDGNYHLWDFKFNPPSLSGVELTVSGWHDFASNSFFVWEIRGLTKLPSSVSGEIDFVNPKYERTVGGKPTRGDGSIGTAPEQFNLDDDELSDTDKATMQLQSDTVTISFADAFITNRISAKTRTVNHKTGDAEKEVCDKNLSANEKEVTGTLPGGSWNNINDQTDDAHLYLNKFNIFLEMVDVLESVHGCKVVNKETVKLPKVGESKKHWLADSQNPRCMAIVELIYDSQLITLLEIDTSDGSNKLSTMMLKTGASGWVAENLESIKVGVIRKSLGWPSDFFKHELTESGFSGIPHPKSKHSGKLDPNEIGPWAQRFVNWMKR